MKQKQKIFSFNHINPSMEKKDLEEVKNLFRAYHKLWWCFKKSTYPPLWIFLKKNEKCPHIVIRGSLVIFLIFEIMIFLSFLRFFGGKCHFSPKIWPNLMFFGQKNLAK